MSNANKTPRTMKPATTTVGSKFEETRGMTIAQIARLVREDIKAAVASGALPEARYSVTSSSYSMGCEIKIILSDVREDGFALFNGARLAWDAANPFKGLCDAPAACLSIHSDRATEILAALELRANVYNRSVKSNEADDYSNTHFHVSVSFAAGPWRDGLRALEAAIATGKMPANDVDAVIACVLSEDVSEQASFLDSIGAL